MLCGAAPARPQSCLELLLRQLVATRTALREEQGGLGEVFQLAEHLLPAPAQQQQQLQQLQQ